MSLTVNCFQDLRIEKCPSFFCCRQRNNTVSVPAAATNGVVYFGATDEVITDADKPYQVCVVQGTDRSLDSVGPDLDNEEDDVKQWDFMLVDPQGRIVFLDGPRWVHLLTVPDAVGEDMSVLRKNMREICVPLVQMALKGLSRQMHTICNNESMTMFANPVYFDKKIIGVQLIYRPTSYSRNDLLKVLAVTKKNTLPKQPARSSGHCEEI